MLSNTIGNESIPRHVAIILDGNGRWAKKYGKMRGWGHQKGAANVKPIVRAAAEMGISILTLYAFSTENWKRSENEVSLLMKLFGTYLVDYTDEINTNNVQLHIIGDTDALSTPLRKKIMAAEQATARNDGLVLNIALNYGGRNEILRAVENYVQDLEVQKREKCPLTEEIFRKYLYPSAAADVDLLIRTGGEQRISNFLLWQISYAELYFTNTLWPDFTAADLFAAVKSYAARERRFGGVINEV